MGGLSCLPNGCGYSLVDGDGYGADEVFGVGDRGGGAGRGAGFVGDMDTPAGGAEDEVWVGAGEGDDNRRYRVWCVGWEDVSHRLWLLPRLVSKNITPLYRYEPSVGTESMLSMIIHLSQAKSDAK